MISANDLKYFIEIAQTKNLSRAAERIGISQPSVTLSIQRIEKSLGTPVLIRTQKGVSLTKAGVNLQKHSKNLLNMWAQVKNEALASTNKISGNISLGCHPSVGIYTLDKFLPKLLTDEKNLELSLTHDISRKITERIISMELDLGLIINPIKHPDLIIKNLCEDVVTLWSAGEKNLNNDPDSSDCILICDPQLLQTQNILNKLKRKGFSFSRILTSNSLENIANLIASGAGVGILPTRVAKKVSNKKLYKVDNSPVFKDTLSVIYRVENKNIESIKYIVKLITDTIY